MAPIDLSSSQERILTSLVDLTAGREDVVCGRQIADAIDRNPGTVRNRMQSLRSLQLVEGVPGPDGGYRPTDEAYETLDRERTPDPAAVPVERNGTPVEAVTVREIDLSSVTNPDLCRAEVVLCGSVRSFERGDRVRVGPTPSAGLRLAGVVDAADVDGNALMLRVDAMETASEEPAAVVDAPTESSESVGGRSASD